MKGNITFLFSILSFIFLSCSSKSENIQKLTIDSKKQEKKLKNISVFDSNTKTIHVLVALCDNKYQGIVPVPPKIGNGQNPDLNLYWGAGYGIRTFFKKSKEWVLLKSKKIDSIKMERLIFQHTKNKEYYLVADDYNGKYIKDCTKDFLYSSAGNLNDTLTINNSTIGIYGNSSLISYIGHDGLMDFQLSDSFKNNDEKTRDIIVIACFSKKYFSPYLKNSKINPILWTSHLMAPEAYTLHDALTGYINQESNEKIRMRAVLAYSKYQKCSEKAARNLLVSGW
ncbi:hypothetical protein O2K51_05605 [Apibacter raozihei]|uniref:hypothetical protein n=1 Tax=Apibacter raozihei TaxID=2500547 RepID=UPI001E5E6C24|nr:hypothetical protein [Apibacter raozihei]